MKITAIAIFAFLFSSCSQKSSNNHLEHKEELSNTLNEISGMVADSAHIWAIIDKPKAIMYKLDLRGELKQQVMVDNATANDVEAIAQDTEFVYIGDTGDNDGNRDQRQIIKVRKSAIGENKNAVVTGELITFNFDGNSGSDKKKKNNYDCEALLSYGDSLYLFTKRRTDMQTELFSMPKTPGYHLATSITVFDTKGLVTDAAINSAKNEVALTGYNKGHKFPFILLLKDFQGCNFFSGKTERIELADKPWDWQIESITYDDKNQVYFACEKTKEVEATLYAIKRENLPKLNKTK